MLGINGQLQSFRCDEATPLRVWFSHADILLCQGILSRANICISGNTKWILATRGKLQSMLQLLAAMLEGGTTETMKWPNFSKAGVYGKYARTTIWDQRLSPYLSKFILSTDWVSLNFCVFFPTCSLKEHHCNIRNWPQLCIDLVRWGSEIDNRTAASKIKD